MLCAHVQFGNRLGGQVIVRRVVSCSGELGAVWGVYRRHLGWRRPLSGTAGRWPSSHFMRICGAVELCFMYFSVCYTSQLKISKSKKKDNMSKERQCSPRPQGAVWKCGSRGILWLLWWIGTRCGYRVAATQDGTFSNVSRTCTVTSVTQNAGSTFHQTLHVNSMVLSLRCHLKTLQSFLWGCLAKSASLADAIQVAGTGCSEDLIVPEATPHFILQFHFTRQTPGRPLGARAQLLLRSQSAILLPSRLTPGDSSSREFLVIFRDRCAAPQYTLLSPGGLPALPDWRQLTSASSITCHLYVVLYGSCFIWDGVWFCFSSPPCFWGFISRKDIVGKRSWLCHPETKLACLSGAYSKYRDNSSRGQFSKCILIALWKCKIRGFYRVWHWYILGG